MTRKEQETYVFTQLARLQVYYGIEIPADRLRVYVEELGHLTPEQVDAAAKRLKQTWRPSGANPYPPIPDFLSAAGASVDGGEYAAITALRTAVDRVDGYDSVSFGDPALHYVIRAYGGWVTLVDWTRKDWDVNEGRLREAYKAAKASGADGGNHLAGRYEADAGRMGRGNVQVFDIASGKVTRKIPFVDSAPSLEAHGQLNALCYTGETLAGKQALLVAAGDRRMLSDNSAVVGV